MAADENDAFVDESAVERVRGLIENVIGTARVNLDELERAEAAARAARARTACPAAAENHRRSGRYRHLRVVQTFGVGPILINDLAFEKSRIR